METTDECAGKGTFWLLVGYCGINVLYNTLGLYLVKMASALMNALSFAILLPCTTLLFFTPLAGLAQETFTVYNWFTVVGLTIVLYGFALYQHYGRAVNIGEDSQITEAVMQEARYTRTLSFQERAIGLDFGLDVAQVRQIYGTEWKTVFREGTKTRAGYPEHWYRHQHDGLAPHWHHLDHDHDDNNKSNHAHQPALEHQHGHVGHGGHSAHGGHAHNHHGDCCGEHSSNGQGHGHQEEHGEHGGHGDAH